MKNNIGIKVSRLLGTAIIACIATTLTATTGLAYIMTDFSGGNGTDHPNQFTGAAGDGWGFGWGIFGSATVQEVRTDNPFGGQSHYLYSDVSDTSTVGIRRRYASSPTEKIDRSKNHTIQIQWRLDNVTSEWSHNQNDRFQIHHSVTDTHRSARQNEDNAWVVEFRCYSWGNDPIHRGRWRLMDGDGEGEAEFILIPVSDISGAVGTIYSLQIELFPTLNSYDVTISDGTNAIRASTDYNGGNLLGFRGDFTEGLPSTALSFFHEARGGGSGPFAYSLNYVNIVPEPSTFILLSLFGLLLLKRRSLLQS